MLTNEILGSTYEIVGNDPRYCNLLLIHIVYVIVGPYTPTTSYVMTYDIVVHKKSYMFHHKRLMELDELSGRITGRLGYTWPTTAYTIGRHRRATVAPQYSIISATTADRTRPQG